MIESATVPRADSIPDDSRPSGATLLGDPDDERLVAMTPAKLCIFAKPPVPGRVKTRLGRRLGGQVAARLASAFFQDVWNSLCTVSGAEVVLATTDVTAPEWSAIPTPQRWDQGSGDLGARQERILARALETSPKALAIGSDCPGLPVRIIEHALRQLDETEAVLGPSRDGGYYLLGLRCCAPGLLSDIPWSVPTTFHCTLQRLRREGLSVSTVEGWFDVDDVGDLAHLRHRLSFGEVVAPHTAALLSALKA